MGTLWNLTSARPLVKAVQELARRSPELAGQFELLFAGRRTASQERLLGALDGLPAKLVRQPYLSHADALKLMHRSDGLCLLLSDLPEASRVIPAKLFEYLAARRSILAVAPRGEVWDLLAGYPDAELCRPDDVEGIVAALTRLIERHRSAASCDATQLWGGLLTAPPDVVGSGDPPTTGCSAESCDASGSDISRFSRRNQAGELATLLDTLILPPAGNSPAREDVEEHRFAGTAS